MAALLAAKGKSKGKGGKLQTPVQNLTEKPAGKGKQTEVAESGEEIQKGKRLARCKTKDYLAKQPKHDTEKTEEHQPETKPKRKARQEVPKAAAGLEDDMTKDDAEEELANNHPKKKKTKAQQVKEKGNKAEPAQLCLLNEEDHQNSEDPSDANQNGDEGESNENGTDDTPSSKGSKKKKPKGRQGWGYLLFCTLYQFWVAKCFQLHPC